MTNKLMKMLFPQLSDTMSKERAEVFLNVLGAVFEVRQKGQTTQLFWLETMPGRYRQAGREISGDQVCVFGQTLLRTHVIWAVLTGVLVRPSDVLQTRPLFNGDKVDPLNAATWRLFTGAAAAKFKTARTPRAAMRLPYINYKGERKVAGRHLHIADC
jgi:hypothetical protein